MDMHFYIVTLDQRIYVAYLGGIVGPFLSPETALAHIPSIRSRLMAGRKYQ